MNAAFDTAVQLAFSVLFNSLWEGIVIALACALILRFVPQMNATTRASVLTVALLTAIALPIATTFAASGHAASVTTPAAATRPLRNVSAPQQRPAASTHRLPNRSDASTSPVQSQKSSAAWFGFERLRFVLPRSVVFAVVIVWTVAALVALIRLVVSLLHLERLKHDALPLAIEYRSRMDRWTRAAKGGRGVRLCRSPEITIPIAVGLFDAMILVPETLIDELSPEDVDRIVLHELAHLRRADDWVNALERIAQALLFFNPGILWIVGRLDLEREVVCDDWVLDQTSEIRQYASCLARVAEITAWPYRAMAAPGAFITRRSMSVRIERLLEAGRDIRIHTSLGPAGFAIAALVALCVVAGYVSPSFAYTSGAAATTHVSRAEHASSPMPAAKRERTPAVEATTAPVVAMVAPTTAPTVAPTPKPAAVRRVSIAHTYTHTFTHAHRTYAISEPLKPVLVAEASSDGYIDELASAGYRNLSLDELIRLKSVGVDAQYIRGLENAGIPHPSVEDLVRLAAVGVTPDYVRQMRSLFPAVTSNDLASLKAVGVTGAYIDEIRADGFTGLSVDDVRSMSAVGVDAAYIREMRGRFGNLSADQLRNMRAVGVTGDYIEQLNSAGLRNLDAQEIEKMRALGVDGAYVRELREAGYPNLSKDDIVRFRALGIDAAFIKDAASHGFRNLSVDQLVRLKASGLL